MKLNLWSRGVIYFVDVGHELVTSEEYACYMMCSCVLGSVSSFQCKLNR